MVQCRRVAAEHWDEGRGSLRSPGRVPKMRPIRDSQSTLGCLMIVVGLLAVQTALIRAVIQEPSDRRLLPAIAAAGFLPLSLALLKSWGRSRATITRAAVRAVFAKRCPECERR